MKSPKFRHVVAGDALVVRFRYHKDQPDLEVKVLEVAPRIKNQAKRRQLLGKWDGYIIVANDIAGIDDCMLYIWSKEPDYTVYEHTYSSVRERNEALRAYIIMIDALNRLSPGSSLPEWLGGSDMPVLPELCKQKPIMKGDVPVRLFNGMVSVQKNDLTNPLGGELILVAPGFGKDAFKVAKSSDGKALNVVISANKENDKVEAHEKLDLADLPVESIEAKAKDGIFEISVTYNLGDQIEVQ